MRGGKRFGAGRKKGSFAQHTLDAQAAKQRIIDRVTADVDKIVNVLIDKAIGGDIAAIKELFDRAFGKATQPISGDKDNPLVIETITGMRIYKDGNRVQDKKPEAA